jgi:hypothetical protein
MIPGMRRLFQPREAAIQSAVMAHWRVLGEPDTLLACIPNQMAHGQPGLHRGLPDLMAIGPHVPGSCRVGFIELKRDARSRVSAAQGEFGALCRKLGVPFRVCVGRDEPIACLEEWQIVRKASHG